ncbi:uncharacterized protein SPPG_01526 [Spizellomyces punctatus DAOM BR117]|uniref:Cyclin-like domain-containing protein n=1 Tax=Spizellomyces punctatus (strain DAOM BR117) TaxID=645134 RepID=A0A0L0HT98_SPIPD|nr:uncharacterized protein SPPG_01526 [Spizellomyces punctatus DAOM BR117]KND04084.1 hypothetical protein SPPG_01526 [Spizellomyces punctatus DAOM BR117]|eukprot:XP_016612123.1 hypothetical protein SPPG_01526 [Spizellomyces punctatus DAOM BR117]
MEDSPQPERKSANRRAAALSFLANISLGKDSKPKPPQSNRPGSSKPVSPAAQDVPDIAVEKPRQSASQNGVGVEELIPPNVVDTVQYEKAPPVQRQYNEKEKAAISFLASISLDASSDKEKVPSVEQVPLQFPVPLGGSFASTGFSETMQSLGVSNTPQASYMPPAYQIYSGRVLNRQRDSTSRRGSLTDVGSVSPCNTMSGHRVTLTTVTGAPLSVFSIIPYRDAKSKPRRRRTRSSKFAPHYFDKIGFNLNMDAVKRRKFAQSYAHLLEPALSLEPKTVENSLYHPFFLDDPELRTGKHRTVITLPCFMGSIIQYSKPSDIKKELNEHFRETHPTVDSTLTLTQIRRLKDRLLKVGEMQDLELSSVACAYVYFEKLVLKNLVSKETRRLVAAVCLFLAAKVNDPKEVNYTKLLETMEKVLDVAPKEVMANEFPIYTALEFTLFVPLWEVMPHLERIIDASASHNTIEDYIENKTFFMHLFHLKD